MSKINRIADLLANRGNPDRTHVAFGVVDSVGTGDVAVTIDDELYDDLSYLKSYTPTVGDLVVVLSVGDDYVVLGAL